MKKKKVNVLFAAAFTLILLAAVSISLPEQTVSAASTGLSQSFVSDGTADDFWDNKNINLPTKYYTSATINGAESNVADLSGVTAMTFTVDNAGGGAFTWNIGIRDAERNVHDNEWLSNGSGSALLIPEGGAAYWWNCANIPAGFKGRVVLPFATMTYDGTEYKPYYTTHSNPVFKMRTSASATGRLDKDGILRSFPTATMNRYMTFYVNNKWEPSKAITFENIEWLDAESETTYEEYLASLNEIDAAAIGAATNETDMNGAIVVDTPIHKNVTLKMQSGGGTTVNSLTNTVGLALRIRNYRSEVLKLEWKLNESSSETFFMFTSGKTTPVKLIWTDGREETANARGNLPIPADFDGTAIVPFSGLALAGKPNNATDINGRPDGNVWQNIFFTQTAGEFSIAEINQIYATNNAGTGTTQYTLKPMKTATSGTETNYAKNLSSWSGTGVTFTKIEGAVSATLQETYDGEAVSAAQAITDLSKTELFYADKMIVTIPEETGKVLKSLKVDGADVTNELKTTENGRIYEYVNRSYENGALVVEAEYLRGFYLIYELNGGFFTDESAVPRLYTSENVGENVIELPVPKWANHSFAGWYNRVEFSHSDAIKFDVLDYVTLGQVGYNNAALKLYARWRDDYTVVFNDVATGAAIERLSVKMGDSVSEEIADEILSRTGQEYAVYADEACAEAVEFPYVGKDIELTLYVKYVSKNFSVRFNTFSNEQLSSRTVTYGDEMGALPTISKEGYTFSGWYVDDAYQEEVTSSTKIYSDRVFYAQWIKNAEEVKNSPLKIVTIVTGGVAALSLTGLIAVWIVTKKKSI